MPWLTAFLFLASLASALVGCDQCGFGSSLHHYASGPSDAYSVAETRLVLASGANVASETSATWSGDTVHFDGDAIDAARLHVDGDAGDAGDAGDTGDAG